MCQLLGMNSSKPSEFCAIFSDFARRGGDIDVHRHGVGLAFYNTNKNANGENSNEEDNKECYVFRDTMPAAFSPKLANFVMDQKYLCTKTINMVSHIRYATKGCVSLDNVHPFTRDMWGTKWIFAHNGDIPRFSDTSLIQQSSSSDSSSFPKYIPNGTTDSEAVFCEMLNSLQKEFMSFPPLNILYQTLQRLCHDIVDNHSNNNDPLIFNFLLSCNEDVLFSFSWPGSRPGSKVWNGLYYQINKESTLLLPSHNTAIIATKPLDTMSGNWIEMKKGELIIFHKGLPHTIGNHDNNITLNVKQQHINNTCSSNSANDNNNNIRMMSDLVVQEVYSKHNKDDFSQEVTVF